MKMKKTLLLISLLSLAVLPGCREAETDIDIPAPSGKAVRTARVRVGFAEAPGTKSQVTVDVEDFTEAYLFAFWASGDAAGEPCMVDGRPVAVYTDSRTFDWVLPVGVPVEVMAMVNAVEDVRREIDLWAAGLSPYTRDDLLSFTYTCSSASDLVDLQYREYNMPMTGRVTVTLDEGNPVLTVPVKRLFAKFNITLDVSPWADEGWTVKAAKVVGAQSNTVVPYFYTGSGAGYRQTDAGKLAAVDCSTAADLVDLDFRDADNKSKAVTFYFLENCQEVSGTAARWSSVRSDLGSAVDRCSYLSVNVTASKAGYGNRSFAYRIYLDSTSGSAMKSTFNVIRNTFRSITLKLGAPQDGFQWTNTNTLAAAPGESVTIPFETSLTETELHTHVPAGLTIRIDDWSPANSAHTTEFPYSGAATVTVSGTAAEGVYDIECGDSDFNNDTRTGLGDVAKLHVNEPIILTATVPSRRIQFERFNVTTTIPKATLVKLLSKIAPGPNYNGVAFTVGAQNLIKNNLSIRNSSGYETADFEGVNLIQVTTQPQPVSNPTALRVSFTLLNTEMGGTQKIDIYNKVDGNTYTKDLDVTARQVHLTRIQTISSEYPHNGFLSDDDQYGLGASVYSVSIDGSNNTVYLKPTAYINGSTVDANILASDIEDYAISIRHDSSSSSCWGDSFDINGFNNNSSNDEKVQLVTDSSGTVDCFKWNYALCSYDTIEDYTEYEWAYAEKVFDSYIKYDGHEECLEGDMLLLCLMNPRADWYGISYDDAIQDEQQAWDAVDYYYSVTLDGTGNDYRSLTFGLNRMVPYPYSSPYLPVIISTQNGKTPDAGLTADGPHAYDVDGFSIMNKPLDNYGRVVIGYEFENENSGECLVFPWAFVDVYREFTIRAGFQFRQVDFYPSGSSTYTFGEGSLSRFIPYLRCPEMTDGTGAHSVDYLLTRIVECTAVSQQGVNAINPSENFYQATNNAEYWWHNLYSPSLKQELWHCYYGTNPGDPNLGLNDRKAVEQNRVVVYDTPKKYNRVVSYYELDYAGPRVSSLTSIYTPGLGPDNHADFCYSWRNIMYWNKPAFRFKNNYSFIIDGMTQTTKVNADGSCNVGKHTKVYFDWERKTKESISKINAYDTRYAIYASGSSGDIVSAYTDKIGGSIYTDTAQNAPSVITGTNFFKVHEPYYYCRTSVLSWSVLGSGAVGFGSYNAVRVGAASNHTPEDLDSHMMNRVFGGVCSFVFDETPFNQ